VRKVEGTGPTNARIVLIGEAPGKAEDAVGEPFVGASGNLQNRWWAEVGIAREGVKIDNLYPYLPPGGKIENVDADTLTYYVHDLRQRMAALDDPYVVVPTGNYATYALTGKGKVKAALRKALGEDVDASEAERKAGITKLRGSVYPYTDLRGRVFKVIPTIHPAWFLYAGGFNSKKQRRAIEDWRRIRRESGTAERFHKQRKHIVHPSMEELETFSKYLEKNPDIAVSVDVETWGKTLSCVGFATSSTESITIPLPRKGQRGREIFLSHIQRACASPSAKVTQGGHYDAFWLAHEGIRLNNWLWDTLAMHHCLHPTDEHSLHYLASIYCEDYRYWKDEAKDAEEIVKYVRDLDALWTYNGMDCCYTRELLDHLYDELVRSDMLDFYIRHYRELFDPILDVMLHGVGVDAEAQKEWHKRLRGGCEGIREELELMAGEELWAKKTFSGPKVRKYFASLGVPKQLRLRKTVEGKKRTETLDEAALRLIATRVTKPKTQTKEQWGESKEAARLLLRFRRDEKVANFLKGAWDKDERIRCQYKFQTEAGRFASSKNPKRTGYNLQNVDREIRDTFKPDPGCVFVKVDLSQIEDRIVKMWTKAPRLVELANRHPEDYDCHRHNAAIIFGKSEEDITAEERYLAKRGVHAAERGMAGKKLSEELLKDFDLVIAPATCQSYIDRFLSEFHEIPEMYFKEIRELMMRAKMLTSNWGRRWFCTYDRFDDDLWRRGYSFNPQADAGDWLNQWGFKPLHYLLKHSDMRSRINLQMHDEVITSCPPGEAYTVALFLVRMLEQPRYYFGNELVVPACVTVARTWGDNEFEFKRLPDKGKFEEVVYYVWEEVNRNERDKV